MNIVRNYPGGVSALQQQINRVFDQFDQDVFGRFEELGGGMFSPPMDVKEDADAYVVHLEVPGIKRDDIDITLQDNALVIRGTRQRQAEKAEGQFRRVERQYGSFARSLSLPRSIDASGVEANLNDGVLEVRLPKAENAKPRQISIGSTRTLEAQNQAPEGEVAVHNDSATPSDSNTA